MDVTVFHLVLSYMAYIVVGAFSAINLNKGTNASATLDAVIIMAWPLAWVFIGLMYSVSLMFGRKRRR